MSRAKVSLNFKAYQLGWLRLLETAVAMCFAKQNEYLCFLPLKRIFGTEDNDSCGTGD